MDKSKEELFELTQGVDYTIDALGRFVFTAAYLLKRGYCCQNGCVNCPYLINFKHNRVK